MIEINNLTTRLVDKKFFKKVSQKVLRKEFAVAKISAKEKGKIDLSIVLVGPARIRKLNKKYRKKDKATDILSFKYNNNLGEIVICPEIVKKNARRFDSTFKKELTRALIHGILHLLGYDHEKNRKAAEKMKKREEYYLHQLNLKTI